MIEVLASLVFLASSCAAYAEGGSKLAAVLQSQKQVPNASMVYRVKSCNGSCGGQTYSWTCPDDKSCYMDCGAKQGKCN